MNQICKCGIFMPLAFLLVALLAQPLSARAADTDLAQAAKKVREVIAHRGSSLDRPENTLASYRRAIEVKATVTECDVRTTKDGVLVSSHDAEVSRTSSGKGKIAEMTLAELKHLDFGSKFDPKYKDERIPWSGRAGGSARMGTWLSERRNGVTSWAG